LRPVDSAVRTQADWHQAVARSGGARTMAPAPWRSSPRSRAACHREVLAGLELDPQRPGHGPLARGEPTL